ncbi:auxin-induced protein 6B-like [Dendrobium catenatum]|nr:auxin-induced protein 6B-like [Dendrobium catenatum]
MDQNRSSNKITEIVRLQQMLKKWKKLAISPKKIFLGRTSSSSSSSSSSSVTNGVPKGFLAVCVGEKKERFVIPTEYLSHRAFSVLLKEAEEEFGFQQEGVLRMPCEVSVFQSILKVVEKNKERVCYCSSEAEFAQTAHCLPPKPIYR